MRTIEKKEYLLQYDANTGKIIGLYDRKNPEANWIAKGEEFQFGVPFLNGVQWEEKNLSCHIAEESEYGMTLCSVSEKTRIQWSFEEDRLDFNLSIPKDCGPRAGVQMDLNLLDLPNGTNWQYQCTPKIIEVDDALQYAFFVFATGDDRYLAVGVNSPLTAWRIKYTYAGHRMIGFQLLTQADDVITGERPALRPVENLSVSMMFGDSCQECLEKLACSMQISIAQTPISGGFPGTEIPIQILGNASSVIVETPDGVETACNHAVHLEQEGIYQIKAISSTGYSHISRVLCHPEWENVFNQVNRFYRDHFQDKGGAFYRTIWADTLTPGDGRNYEGTAFGKPEEQGSCRSGEFGGFAAWAMMKNQLLFGEKAEFSESIQKYIEHWALNRGHEDAPYYGTIYKKPQDFRGRKYGSYHLYQEYNYPQHELFLVEELTDYYKICGDSEILQDVISLAEHFMTEHIQEDGMVVCENYPGQLVDYSTVHPAVCGFIRLSEILKEKDSQKSQVFLNQAEKIADHVCKRGLKFPTEGEVCTEDGSMACSVITLLWAYLKVSSKKEYLTTAEEILWNHRMLVMDSTDCRMRNSSLRFWETQYETRDWGPSINAGHAWTIWGAEAMALMSLIKCDISLLRDSYEGFVTNLCKVKKTGAMPSCYTPDMIPGSPHAPCIWGVSDTVEDDSDLRPTSTYLAKKMVSKTYAASGNYFLIKAAEIWGYISGVWIEKCVGINGIFKGGIFESKAPDFDELLLSALPENGMTIKCEKGKTLTLYCPKSLEKMKVLYADIKCREKQKLVLVPQNNEIEIRIDK